MNKAILTVALHSQGIMHYMFFVFKEILRCLTPCKWNDQKQTSKNESRRSPSRDQSYLLYSSIMPQCLKTIFYRMHLPSLVCNIRLATCSKSCTQGLIIGMNSLSSCPISRNFSESRNNVIESNGHVWGELLLRISNGALIDGQQAYTIRGGMRLSSFARR